MRVRSWSGLLSSVGGTLPGMDVGRDVLFDEVDRTDVSPSSHQESTFEFLNRIAGDYWELPEH